MTTAFTPALCQAIAAGALLLAIGLALRQFFRRLDALHETLLEIGGADARPLLAALIAQGYDRAAEFAAMRRDVQTIAALLEWTACMSFPDATGVPPSPPPEPTSRPHASHLRRVPTRSHPGDETEHAP